MARRWWRTGLLSSGAAGQRAFAAAAADYVPEIRARDFTAASPALRAQAVARDGGLVDDFVLSETERALHVATLPRPRPPRRWPWRA